MRLFLLWESVAGTYEGTVEATGATGGSTCTWDVGLTMKRVYAPNTNRGVCNLETDYRSSLTTKIDLYPESGDDCIEVNSVGIVETYFRENELSNPEWPVTLLLEMEQNIGDGNGLDLFPFNAKVSRVTDSNAVFTWIAVDSSGAMYERPQSSSEMESAFAYWQWNVQRISRDEAP